MRLSRSAYEAFLNSYHANIIKGKAPDLWLMPYFEGKDTEVRYAKGQPVDTPDFKIPVAPFKNSKLGSYKKVKVFGKLVNFKGKDYFIATGFKSVPDAQMSAPLQLHLLHSAQFLTPLRLTSVFSVIGAKADGTAIYSELPRSKDEVLERYKGRIQQLNEVLIGERRWYWVNKDKKAKKTRVLPIPEVLGLIVCYVPGRHHL